jgi:hypothetical protein
VAPELAMLRMTGAIMDSPVMASSARLGVFLKGEWNLFDLGGLSLFCFAPNHEGYVFGRLPTPAGRAVIRTMLEEFFVACSATSNSVFAGRAGGLSLSLRDLDHVSWGQGDEHLFLKLHTAIGVFFQALMYGDPPPGQSWRGEGAVDLLVEQLWAVLVAERHQDVYPHSLFYDGNTPAGRHRYSLPSVRGAAMQLPVLPPAPITQPCMYHVGGLVGATHEDGSAVVCTKATCLRGHPATIGRCRRPS